MINLVGDGWFCLSMALIVVVIYQQRETYKLAMAQARCRLTHQLRPEFEGVYGSEWPEVVTISDGEGGE